jgi:predicted esterase
VRTNLDLDLDLNLNVDRNLNRNVNASVIEGARELAPIAPGRVFVVGHSNGGFMAHRMACDRCKPGGWHP